MDVSNRLLHVYGKTPAGTAALRSSRDTLPSVARRILILIDGQRSIGELANIFPHDVLEESLALLEAQGLVECLRHFPDERPGFADTTFYAPLDTPVVLPAGRKRSTQPYVLAGLAALIGGGVYLATGSGSSEPAAPAAATAATGGSSSEPSGGDATKAPPPNPAAAAPVPAAALVPALKPALTPPSAPESTPAREAAAASAPPPPPASAIANGTAVAPKPAVPPADAAPGPEPAAPSSAAPATSRATARPTVVAAPVVAPAGSSRPAPATAARAPQPPAPVPTPANADRAALPPALAPAPFLKLKVRRQITPLLPKAARDLGITSGRVVVVLQVNPGGTVDHVDLISATPPQVYDEDMQLAFEEWTFEPLGVPGRMTVEVLVGNPAAAPAAPASPTTPDLPPP